MNKTALITGTTSGIGAAFCDLLAKEGYKLILVARDGNALAKQADRLGKLTEVHSFCYDLSKPGVSKNIFADVAALGLFVDILINNAGFNEAGYFTKTSLLKEQDMVRVHIEALTELTKLFLPGMLERRYGRILNMGSTGSYMPCPCDAVYAATKAYVLSFSNGLYQELKGSGVTVTCLCPGATETQFAKKANIDQTHLFKIFVMQPDTVAKIGYKNMLRGKRTVTAGLYNKLLVLLAKFLPVSLINPIARWMIKAR